MEIGNVTKFDLTDGLTVEHCTLPELGDDSFIVKLMRDGEILSVTCSCNGVSKTCATGKEVTCNCTANPPKLSCT